MKTITASLVAVVTTVTLSAQAVDVSGAIADGTKTKKPWNYGAWLGSDSGGNFQILVRGPYGRVASAAAEAASKYQPFTPEQVTEAMTAPVLEVQATPGTPAIIGTTWSITPPATHLVLRVKTTKAVIQPTALETFPREWTNALGGKFEGQGVTARFDLAALPPGDLEVVVITAQWEQARTLKASDRAKIR